MKKVALESIDGWGFSQVQEGKGQCKQQNELKWEACSGDRVLLLEVQGVVRLRLEREIGAVLIAS